MSSMFSSLYFPLLLYFRMEMTHFGNAKYVT